MSVATPLLGAMFVTCLSSACIAPVDLPDPSSAPNYPPEIDLSSISPQGGRLDWGRDCEEFMVQVNRIRDRDNDTLLFRWVANNDRPNTRLIDGATRQSRPDPSGEHFAFVSVRETSFPNEYALGETGIGIGVLSLFVTDAPAYDIPDEEAGNPDQERLDLGRIPQASDPEASQYSVVEVRWAVAISDNLEGCPQ